MSDEFYSPIIFVIDTDSYAGNFERELCAYVTGVVGECEVGSDEASTFKEETNVANSFEDIINQVGDGNGVYRPTAIWPTPGRDNNGMGTHFNIGDPIPEIDWEKFNMDENNFTRIMYEERGPITYPAYESVAIFFNKELDENMVKLMKARAATYCKRKKIKIVNFRMITQVVVVSEKII